jgi:hypothetical protein
MFNLVAAALGLTAVTVLIHGFGAAGCLRYSAHRWALCKDRPGQRGAGFILTRLVTLLLLLHLAEAALWGFFYVLVNALPDLETAMYYSLTSYATVGYGDVIPTKPWRLLGPIEGSVGVLMLGWSTGVLVAVIQIVYRQRFAASRDEADAPPTRQH